jgi:hypothetical protein
MCSYRDACFRNLQAATSWGEAVYFWARSFDLSVILTDFEGCESTDEGGAIYAAGREHRINRTCFSYCHSSNHGNFVRAMVPRETEFSGIGHFCELSERGFVINLEWWRSFLNEFHGAVLFSAWESYESDTLEDLSSDSTCVINSDSSGCATDHEFSTSLDCRHTIRLYIYGSPGSLDKFAFANFVSNVLLSSVSSSVDSGCLVSDCIIQGNSQVQTFMTSSGSRFVVSDCVFDHEVSSSWTSSGTGNAFNFRDNNKSNCLNCLHQDFDVILVGDTGTNSDCLRNIHDCSRMW